jgi:hypothetical protein
MMAHVYYQALTEPVATIPYVPPAVPALGWITPWYPYVPLPLQLSAAAINAAHGHFQALLTEQIRVDKWLPSGQGPYPVPTNSAILLAMQHTGSAAPIPFVPFGVTLANFFVEWFPQWQRQTSLPAHIANVALVEPVIPTPFTSTAVLGLPWWQQETQQIQASGRFDYLKLFPGAVYPILPQPFVPGPPPICPNMPLGFDADTTDSIFVDRAGRPIAVLMCRRCMSGLPLLVRGDFAIWCQTCCAFVSYEDTVMQTTRSPKFFRGTF